MYLKAHYDKDGKRRQNVKSLCHRARLDGAFLAAAGEAGVEVIEVIPAQRLNAVGLPGNLDRESAKAQCLFVVNAMFGMNLSSHDAADAVAIGLAAWGKMKHDSRS